MLESFFYGEDIIFDDALGLQTDKIYLRREGEEEILRKYIGGGGVYQTVFSLCLRTGLTGDALALDAVLKRISARPLPDGVICFEVLKTPHLTNNSAATKRFEAKCRIIYAMHNAK